MNCDSFREKAIDLIVPGAAYGDATAALADHAARCPACAAYLAEMQAALDLLKPSCEIKASAQFKERVMKKLMENEEQPQNMNLKSARPRRLLPWWQALAAATLLIAGYLGFMNFISRDTGSAWAVEKTIAAYEGLKFIHIAIEPVTPEHAAGMWAQFDGQGKLETLRFDFAETADGPKVVLWQADKAQVWFKKKNSVAVVKEPAILKRMKMSVNDFDPRALVAGALRKASKPASITPSDIAIVVESSPNLREVFHIDPKTNLVTSFEKFIKKDGKEELAARFRYLEYNDPKVAEAFNLPIPKDALRIDETAQTIGLLKGGLSNEAVAVQIVREFMEALIAKDYAKASQLYGGLPAAMLEKNLGSMRFLRIVSIGVPTPFKANDSLKVPCKIEVEKDGKKEIWEPYGPFVRPVYNQPERWAICGGI